ncbi:Uncharacterized protein QTN25_006881 [Entamoeba marina]
MKRSKEDTQRKRSTLSVSHQRQSHQKVSPKISPATSPRPKKRQSVLDFSQRKPGEVTCPICHLTYQPVVAEDVKTHEKFHKEYLLPPLFQFPKGIYQDVLTKNQLKYIKVSYKRQYDNIFSTLLNSIKDDIDMDTSYTKNEQFTFFVCVEHTRIVGLLIGRLLTPKHTTYECKVDDYDKIVLNDKNIVHCKCGIEVLWVHSDYRRKKIANELVNIEKAMIRYGEVFTNNEIAVTQPTKEGFRFFHRYFGTVRIYVE